MVLIDEWYVGVITCTVYFGSLGLYQRQNLVLRSSLNSCLCHNITIKACAVYFCSLGLYQKQSPIRMRLLTSCSIENIIADSVSTRHIYIDQQVQGHTLTQEACCDFFHIGLRLQAILGWYMAHFQHTWFLIKLRRWILRTQQTPIPGIFR